MIYALWNIGKSTLWQVKGRKVNCCYAEFRIANVVQISPTSDLDGKLAKMLLIPHVLLSSSANPYDQLYKH